MEQNQESKQETEQDNKQEQTAKQELSRAKVIERTSVLNIVVNILLAVMKIGVGLAASSMAFVTEGANNATDALTSLLTLVGTRLAGKHPDEQHPFGYGRIEYLTSLAVSALILVTGVNLLRDSIERIFHPEELSVNMTALILIAVSAAVKFVLGTYTIRTGKKTGSGALEAVGIECRNDSFVSGVTILSSAVWLAFGWNVDAWAGVLISLIIIKAGGEALWETLQDLLGRPGDKELADALYKKIRGTDGVINAADMMLHNYGPDAWSGSVNVEMDHKLTVGEIYRTLHALQLEIMHEQNVTMVFGIYAVDNDNEYSKQLRKDIAQFVRGEEHVRSYHAVYQEQDTGKIYCDLIVEYKLQDWDSLRERFIAYMGQKYPGHDIELVIETEFV